MGPNPMQKVKRNAIIIGIFVGLAVGVVLAIAAYFILGGSFGVQTTGGTVASVMVLNRNIKSGETIQATDLVETKVASTAVPADATTLTAGTIATAKIDLSQGTILTVSMLNAEDTAILDDLRLQEYNMIALPSTLATGNYIDIRLQLPNGADYIVVSKKKVLNCNATTVWLNMREEEIEILSNAIIEYYIMSGSKLYATTYTEPGLQKPSTGTYVPNSAVVALINSNPNITSLINSERYSEALKSIRNNNINAEISKYSENDKDITNIETKIQEEIKNIQQARQAYFSQLNAGAY